MGHQITIALPPGIQCLQAIQARVPLSQKRIALNGIYNEFEIDPPLLVYLHRLLLLTCKDKFNLFTLERTIKTNHLLIFYKAY